MIELLYFIPKNMLSYLFGLLAIIPLPVAVREPFYSWYAKRYGVVVEEAAKSLEEYESLQAFFTRDLKPGLRPVGEGVVSPVDGTVAQCGLIEEATLLQAKAKDYSLQELLHSSALAERFSGGSYLTVYLAPGDYHHIHAPLEGKVRSSVYVPGTLWPVNEASVERIDGLFVKNERIITYAEHADTAWALVKVGATNVGSIRTTYNDFRANPFKQLFGFRPTVVHQEYHPGITLEKAQRVGSFYLGSTVVLLLTPGYELRCEMGAKLRYGESIASAKEQQKEESRHG